MANEKQIAAAEKSLAHNKGLNEVYVTEDGNVFINKNAAVNYSVKKKLKADNIYKAERESAEEVAEEKKAAADKEKAEADAAAKAAEEAKEKAAKAAAKEAEEAKAAAEASKEKKETK